MEIERKFLVRNIPSVLDNCNKRYIEQAYLCTSPTVRVRRDNDDYYLTYKAKGSLYVKNIIFLLPKSHMNIFSPKLTVL